MPRPGAGPTPTTCGPDLMAVHRAAADGFGAQAGAYERGRPGFPPDAIALLVAEFGLGPGRDVVDLGAGTGKLTRLLLPCGARMVDVEPVAAMREALAAAVPGVEVLEGVAEAIPLPPGSADAVVVSQAFHWFQGERALSEIHRVLRPEGGLALLWNDKDATVPWVARLDAVIHRYRGDVPSFRTARWREVFATTGTFTDLQERSFPLDQVLDVDGLVDRVRSISFMATLPPGEWGRVEEEVRALVGQAGLGPEVVLPYLTHVFWCRRR